MYMDYVFTAQQVLEILCPEEVVNMSENILYFGSTNESIVEDLNATTDS